MIVQSTEPVVSMMGRLDQALGQAEVGTLATDAYGLIEEAIELIDPMLEEAVRQGNIGDFGAGAQAWKNLADLCDRMAPIMRLVLDRMLADRPAAGNSVASLSAARLSAARSSAARLSVARNSAARNSMMMI